MFLLTFSFLIIVILSPYGLAGCLTGQAYKEGDASVQKLLNEWKQFYPIYQSAKGEGSNAAASRPPSQLPSQNTFRMDIGEDAHGTASNSTPASGNASSATSANAGQLPAAVEVVVAGIKMKYPSCYIYTTETTNSPLLSSKGGAQAKSPATSSVTLKEAAPITSTSSSSLLTPPNSPAEVASERPDKLKPPSMAPRQPLLPSSGYQVRDGICQEVNIFQTDKSGHQQATSAAAAATTTTTTTGTEEPISSHQAKWEFSDPCSKINCNCFRCKITKKGPNQASKSGSGANIPGSSSSSSNKKLDKAELKQQQKNLKGLPFHKRNLVLELSIENEAQSTCIGVDNASSKPLAPSTLTTNAVNQATSNQAQPKTPNFAYKSPGPGGLSSIQSSVGATTPGGGGLDSPRSVAPSITGDGPLSTNPDALCLSSVSPHPVKEDRDGNSEQMAGPSPAMGSSREKTHLEQLLSPYQSASSASNPRPTASQQDVGSPAIGTTWTPGSANPGTNSQPTDQTDGGNEAVFINGSAGGGNNAMSESTKGIKRPLLTLAQEELESERLNRTTSLYDFSSLYSISSDWDLPAPKNRRIMSSTGATSENGSSEIGCSFNSKQKDPYEFSEFDDSDPFNQRKAAAAAAAAAGDLTEENTQTMPNVDGHPAPETESDLANGQQASLTDQQKQQQNHISTENGAPMSPSNQRVFSREEDLTASLSDLDQIFDTSSGDDSNDFQAPNAPGKGNAGSNGMNGGSEKRIKNNNSTSSILGVAELTRMFPTPPSLEPNAAPSPLNGNLDATLLDEYSLREKIDIYPSSPAYPEHLKVSYKLLDAFLYI